MQPVKVGGVPATTVHTYTLSPPQQAMYVYPLPSNVIPQGSTTPVTAFTHDVSVLPEIVQTVTLFSPLFDTKT